MQRVNDVRQRRLCDGAAAGREGRAGGKVVRERVPSQLSRAQRAAKWQQAGREAVAEKHEETAETDPLGHALKGGPHFDHQYPAQHPSQLARPAFIKVR